MKVQLNAMVANTMATKVKSTNTSGPQYHNLYLLLHLIGPANEADVVVIILNQ